MEEEKNHTISFYPGADYGLEPGYGSDFLDFSVTYRTPASQFGYPSDPTSANQLKAVSDKLNTGATTVEVSTLNIMGGPPGALIDKIPRQHFEEINRLRKLVGIDLTVHGPLIEPTGIEQRNWDPMLREQAERQIWNAVDRAHDLNPDGNVIVTFHTSSGLPETRGRVKTEDGKEISTSLAVVDSRTGRFGVLPRATKDYLEGREPNVDEELTRLNEQNWSTELSNVNISASRARDTLSRIDLRKDQFQNIGELKKLNVDQLYKMSTTPEGRQKLDNLDPDLVKVADELIGEVGYADIFVKDAYTGFQKLFNEAYYSAETDKNEEARQKLNKLKDELAPIAKQYKEDPSVVAHMAEAISRGIRVLDGLKSPQTFRPLEKFAVDQASETFSNVALQSYKKFGDNSPIICVENPPAGMGLYRAEEVKKLIETTRKKLTEKLAQQENLSRGAASKQAEKLIGATWDVGHINMIRKYGYDETDVVKESAEIAPYVKHVHLSDNFGLEHTELPMGMGNVPIKKILELRQGFEKAKKIIETGDWFSRQGGLAQTQTPALQSLRAFGSPVYSMAMAPYWNQVANRYGNYFSGYGRTLPDQHFNLYGAGFSNLPIELGGQMAGKSRVSGAPIE